MWHLRRRACSAGNESSLSGPLAVSLDCWATALADSLPRIVRFQSEIAPIILMTDGYCEFEGKQVEAGIGAIIFDPSTDTAESFGERIPAHFIEMLREECGYDQLIAQAEISPGNCCMRLS